MSFIKDEVLEPLNLSVSRAADVLDVRRATLSDLVNGKAALSPEMALQISRTDLARRLRGFLQGEGWPDALRLVVQSMDPQLPLTHIESIDEVVAEGQAPRRFNTALISGFAAAAIMLALLGIYSVIAFSTALRTQEMAIRLALGSQRSTVMRLVLISAAKLGLVGSAVGAVAAIFATRLLRSLLFQVDPLDPTVFVLGALAIFSLALAVSLIPAYRAAATDPMQALRAE